jgi:ABC-type uncharacterized transport system substrate-binding protein
MTLGLRAALCLLWLLLAPASAGAEGVPADARVLLVTSAQSGAYAETVAAIRAALGPAVVAADILAVDWQALPDETLHAPRIIVTVGTQAAQAVAERSPRPPVLHTLVPHQTWERLAPQGANGRASAIFLDQPVERQLALIAEALPEWRRLALIASPRSEPLAAQLAAGAQLRRWTVTLESVTSDRDLYPALQRVLAAPAVLLALPDSTVFNSYTIQNVLLTAYRHQSPVIGFSPAYVRAGALLALYSTPSQIGAQAAAAVRTVLEGGALPAPAWPRQFEIGINQNVARSLGITLDPAEQIAARLARRERGP